MACCSLKCLQCMVFTVALIIMVAVGIGPIVFGILYRNQKIVQALDMSTLFLATTISVGAVVIIFSFCGLCGACKSSKKTARYCLCWYFIFLVIVIVLVVGMLILFILINKNGEDNLKEFCDSTTKTYSGIWTNLQYLRNYDTEIKTLGGTGDRFCQTNCPCQVPAGITSTASYRNTHLNNSGTAATSTGGLNISTTTTGAKSISDCTAYWDGLGKFVKAVISLMGEVENQFNCSGVCIGANMAIGKDSTNVNVLTNFNNGEGSCFTKIVDFSKQKWVPGIGLFAGLLAVLFFSIVFVCCICYHDDLKE